MQFEDCVMQRYATKKFDGRTIPEEKVTALLELVRFAPSAINLQPWRIRVVRDKKTKEALFAATFSQDQVTTCSHLLVFCADPDYESLIRRLGALLEDHGIPEEVRMRVTGMARDFTAAMPAEQRLAWSQAQTYMACANALLGAKSLGFDSCPMGGFDPEAYRKILAIPPQLVPVILCPIGYAADKPMPKARFPLQEILF